MSLVRCLDGVTPAAIPPAHAILGYVDGDYQTYPELRATRTAFIVSVTVFGEPGAHVIDCEPGNVTPDQAAAWAHAELRAGRRPTVYGGRETHDLVWRRLEALHVRPTLIDYYLADYVQVAPVWPHVRWPHALPVGYVAWQFCDSIRVPGGHTIDASVVSSRWLHGLGWRPRHHLPRSIKFVRG